jgi:hypothetical protein
MVLMVSTFLHCGRMSCNSNCNRCFHLAIPLLAADDISQLGICNEQHCRIISVKLAALLAKSPSFVTASVVSCRVTTAASELKPRSDEAVCPQVKLNQVAPVSKSVRQFLLFAVFFLTSFCCRRIRGKFQIMESNKANDAAQFCDTSAAAYCE